MDVDCIVSIDYMVFRTIDQIYVDDPKKAFNPDWESIAQVVHENQEWKRDMKHVSSRKKFVEEMINIKTGLTYKSLDIFMTGSYFRSHDSETSKNQFPTLSDRKV